MVSFGLKYKPLEQFCCKKQRTQTKYAFLWTTIKTAAETEVGVAELILPEIVAGTRNPTTISGKISSASPASIFAAFLILLMN